MSPSRSPPASCEGSDRLPCVEKTTQSTSPLISFPSPDGMRPTALTSWQEGKTCQKRD